MTARTDPSSRPFDPTGWLLRTFGAGHLYDDLLDRERARVVSVLAIVFSIVTLVASLLLIIAELPTLNFPAMIINLANAGLFYLAWRLAHLRQLRRANIIFTAAVWLQMFHAFLASGSNIMITGLAAPLVVSALLLGQGWALATLVVASAGIAAKAIFGSMTGTPFAYVAAGAPLTGIEAIIGIGGLLFVTVFVELLGAIFYRTVNTARRQARQLEAAAIVAETAASTTSTASLLEEVVERIRVAYGFYHAQVFLLDTEKRMARLEASTGRAGETLLSRGHALAVGSQSVIGQCTSRRIPVVINDVTRSETHRANPLLPDTRAELALPLLVGNTVIGALDVQSTTPEVFQPEDVRSLQILASQLASAVDKARLLDELQARNNENVRLLEDSQRSLIQVEELSRRLTREGWTDYLRGRRKASGMGYTLQGEDISRDPAWSATMKQAYQGERSVVVRQDRNAHIAAVPLRVRGEVIGVLEIERGEHQPWTESELEMAESLVERLSLALENARLYEQATLSATREQIVNQIAQEVQSASSIDEVLQSALIELSNVLGAARGVVQINPKDSPGSGAGNGAEEA